MLIPLFPICTLIVLLYSNHYMEKLLESQILVKDAKLEAVKLDENNLTVSRIIDETKQKQIEILKLKEVDQDRLRMVVQL